MKVKLKVKKTFDIKIIQIKAGVRYWEDSEINGKKDNEDSPLMPLTKGNLWNPNIEIETGVVVGWPENTQASIHYKVADCCGWEIRDINGKVVLKADDGYVPKTLCPKENGYGDYIIMDIDKDGKIANWDFDIKDFK